MAKELSDMPFRLRYHRVMEMIDDALDSVHTTQKQILEGAAEDQQRKRPSWGGGDNASGPSRIQSSTMLTGIPPPPELRRQVPVNEKVSRMLQHVAVLVSKSQKPSRHKFKKLDKHDSTNGLTWAVKAVPSEMFILPKDEEKNEKFYKINYFGKESFRKYPSPEPKPEKQADPLPDIREADPATGKFQKVKCPLSTRRPKGSWNPVPTATLRRAQLRADALVERESWDSFFHEGKAPGGGVRLPRIRYRRAHRKAQSGGGGGGDGGDGGDGGGSGSEAEAEVEPDPFKSVHGSSSSDLSEVSDDRSKLWERQPRRASGTRLAHESNTRLPFIASRHSHVVTKQEMCPKSPLGNRQEMIGAAWKSGRLSLLTQIVRFPHISAARSNKVQRGPFLLPGTLGSVAETQERPRKQ